MKFSKRFSLAALLATATALTPSVAQTVSDEVTPEARLDIPDGQTLFGKNDPNVRRATAQVNGEIITGTDIDHRLALIVAANNNQLPPEEVARFRAQILTNLNRSLTGSEPGLVLYYRCEETNGVSIVDSAPASPNVSGTLLNGVASVLSGVSSDSATGASSPRACGPTST